MAKGLWKIVALSLVGLLVIGLLVVIAAVALFIALGHRSAQQPASPAPVPAPQAQPPQQQPAAPEQDDEVRVRIQPAG